MKTKLPLIFSLILLALSPVPSALSQIPQAFNYQAIVRNTAGEVLQNKDIKVTVSIKTALTGGIVLWEEYHNVTSNQFGLVTFGVGKGTFVSGTATSFDKIDWKAQPLFLKTVVEYPVGTTTDMGTAQILSVPYSLVAKDVESPIKKLGIRGTEPSVDSVLFEVKNKYGQTVFAVYPEGVRVYVADGAKGAKGGFAVGSFGTGKAGESQKYLMVTKDSIRMYLDSNPLTKSKKGGFAVGGYDLTKAGIAVQNYLDVSEDSVRIYIDNNPVTKGKKGGFAVGGYDMAKGPQTIENFLNVATDTLGKINPSQNRLLWYPQKNAFLTGKVLIEKRDSVGVNSFATGYESKAVGNWSQALGYKTAARGDYSTSIGNNSNANGLNSFAFGNAAKVTGNDSYAFGTGAIASGPQSFALGSSKMNDSTGITVHTVASAEGAFALGFGSVASSNGAFAMGVLDTASGPGSLSMGYFNKSIGWFSTTLGAGNTVESAGWQGLATGVWTKAGNWASSSFGDRTYASGHTSFATGFKSVASGHLSAAFGDQTVAPSWGSFAIGKYNAYSGSAEGWSSGDPLFMVGIGTSGTTRKNALTVFKNGVTEFNHGTIIDYDRIELNSSGTGNRVSYIDFHSDNNYSDYSFRIFRNSGLNGSTDIAQRGLGDLNFITFEDADIAFTARSAERMRITSNGFVGINTYPTYQLDVAGSININKGISNIGALFVNGYETIWFDGSKYSWGYGGSYNAFNGHVAVGTTGTSSTYALWVSGSGYATVSFINGSDIRWKKNIDDLENVTDKIMQLKGVTYEWKQDEFPEMNFDSGNQIGLIAQDVEKIFPELVKTDEKGYKGISYDKLSVILLEGLKEQQKKIESQNEKIDRLEKMVENLMAKK